jgi:hypothetical protein
MSVDYTFGMMERSYNWIEVVDTKQCECAYTSTDRYTHTGMGMYGFCDLLMVRILL